MDGLAWARRGVQPPTAWPTLPRYAPFQPATHKPLLNPSQTPAPESTPAFGAPSAADAAEGVGAQATQPTWRGVGAWQEDWGERLVAKRPPAVFVLDVQSRSVTHVEGPEGSSCGQPTWTPNGDGLVFTVWPHRSPTMPRIVQRLGMVYCFNRPAALHLTAWPPSGQALRLTPPALLHTSLPCFSPSGNTLVALSHDAAVGSGVHHATGALMTAQWPVCGCVPVGGGVQCDALLMHLVHGC